MDEPLNSTPPAPLPDPPVAGRVTLIAAWGRHEAGTVLAILPPGESPAAGFVDAARAHQLVRDGLAAEGAPEPASAAPKKRATRKET